jgi:eukaryotic-like serine/threonine-protein kinase
MEVLRQLDPGLADRYRIDREIGAGGMATVYLAEDIRHRRRVALKVLRPELGAVLGPDRFLSEINVTANLQHPHLLPLFDSGEVDGLLFYVMPFVEGESLRARLDRERQLPVDDAVRIALAIASALDYAHRNGVIHRDLKPENILLQDGQPLIADFGIALAVSNAGGARVTQTGLSLGTPQYMSPEQATGDRIIDARSDIYSLGAVLYEMLVGDPPHLAGTTQAVIAKVLTEKPPSVRAYRDSVPENVDAAVQRALAKLPADRFASAGEFADVLTGARVLAQAGTIAVTAAHALEDRFVFRIPERVKRRVRAVLPWAVAAAAVTFAGAMASLPRSAPGTGSPTLFAVTFSDSVEVETPGGVTIALSRDGAQLAFVGSAGGVSGLFIRRMDDLAASFVRGTERAVGQAFSPDGRWLVFTAGDKIWKVPVGGGAPVVVSDSGTAGGHVDWGDGNTVVYGYGDRLWRVSGDGGVPVAFAQLDTTRRHVFYGRPQLLPGGKAALITIWKGSFTLESAELGVVTLEDGRVTELGIRGTGPVYTASGHVLFGRSDGGIFAAPFSLRRLRLSGEAVPVLTAVVVKSGGAVELAVSNQGTVVFKAGRVVLHRRLVRVVRGGAETSLGADSGRITSPRVSPDGRRIALAMQGSSTDIWLKDLVNGALTRVTTSGSYERPEWTPDGQRIAYVSRSGTASIRVQPWDGSGAAEDLLPPDRIALEISLGPPGGWLATRLQNSQDSQDRDIHIAPMDSPQVLRPFLVTPAEETAPRVSPDGQLLAYVSNETGRREVYVRPLPGPGGRVQVSLAGGDEPMWARNGSELYFRAPGHMVAARIAREPALDIAGRDSLFPDPYVRSEVHAQYDVFPDGSGFVFVKSPLRQAASNRLMGMTNWPLALPGGGRD